MTRDEKRQLCSGCRNEYYHGIGTSANNECWSFKDATVVTRFRLDWWTPPTTPRAFREVQTLDCHHAPGKYAHSEKLPSFAVEPIRLRAFDQVTREDE